MEDKLFGVEIAEAFEKTNIIELAERAADRSLNEEDKEIIKVVDDFAKEIGEAGRSDENDKLIAELIRKTVEPMVNNVDSSILEEVFDMGETLGEFDEFKYSGLPENTIMVYDAVRGGNVPKSMVDPGLFDTKKVSLQAEVDLDYSDLRRNGWKSIAKMTELALERMEQEKFYRLFAAIDSALDTVEGDQSQDVGSALGQANMDSFTRYLRDYNDGGAFMVGLSRYIDKTKRLEGHEKYMSDGMKNELNRLGTLSVFDGIKMTSIPTAKKLPNGKNLMPDGRILGVAGKIGEAAMRGELRVYTTYDNDAEKVRIKLTGYDFEYVIYYLDKIARIAFSK